MPRYYFHIRKQGILEDDQEGADFPTVDDAYNEAILAAREILAEKVLAGEPVDGQLFEITTDDGTVLREVPFKTAMTLR